MAENGVYVVRPGDTVRSVATNLGVPAMELCRVNGLRPGDQLKPGQKLRLPRLQKVEPTQNLWQGGDKTPAQGFESLRHMQTQLIQLPKFGISKKQDLTTTEIPKVEDADDKARAAALQAKMAKKKKLLEKESSESKSTPRDIRLRQEAALQAKRLGDKLNDTGDFKLVDPFAETAPRPATPAHEAPRPAEAERKLPPPPPTPPPPPPPSLEPGDSTDPGLGPKKEPPLSTRLFARRRQKGGVGPGNTETVRKTMLFEPAAGREATRILSLSDVAAALDTGDAFRHLDEGAGAAKGGKDQFKSLASKGGSGSDATDSFKMAGSGAQVAGGDRFNTGKKSGGESEDDVFKRYRTLEGADPSDPGSGEDLATGADQALRKDQIRIGDRRLALPSSLMTQSMAEPGRTDSVFAKALEGAVEPGKSARIELGPGLQGPEPILREIEGIKAQVERLEILRSKDSRYLTQLSLRGASSRWPELSIAETYQFNPEQAGDLTRMFMLLSRPQPMEFLERLRVVKREFELGPLPARGEACLAFGLQTARGGNGPRTFLRWLEEIAPQSGGLRAWEEARGDLLGILQLLPAGADLDKALAARIAQRSLTTPGPSPVQAVWHALFARSWRAAQAKFLDELAGPFPAEERVLSIGWAHLPSGPPKIEIRLVLAETWSKRVLFAEPFQPPAGTRIEICWSAGSPKWTQRPKAVEALWKAVQGSVVPAELQLAETFAASFFKQGTLTMQHHAAGRKPFPDFARALLTENRLKGELSGQSQGRSPSQLWTTV